jgi:O-antigen biosynthesis protein
MRLSERHPVIRAKRRAGRIKRWVKRRLYERNIGKEYQAWLAQAAGVVTGSVENAIPVAVIVPVFNPPIAFLRECLDSVLGQTARHWQLIVSDDGSTDPQVMAYLDAFAAEHAADPRIEVVRSVNGGISAAMNAGLAQVDTTHVGWLDHDDVLDPRAFAEVASVLQGSDPDIVYSDEDKIDTRGHHFELYAKPDFSPELLLTQMYLCHFTVFRTGLLREVGGFRTQMDGAQDFDVALRLLPRVTDVAHIARPLYHWRAWSESTALTIDAKPWAQQATARVQREYLEQAFGGGTVEPSAHPGLNEVHPRVGGSHVVSVVIPTIGTPNADGTARFVDDAVESLIRAETSTPLEFVIVTTGVMPQVHPAHLGRHRIVHVVHEAPSFNFSEAINAGRAAASGDYLLLLNDDTTALGADPVTRMLELGQIPQVGIVGCKLTYPDGRLQHVGMILLPSGPTHAWIGRPAKEPGYFGSTLTPRNYAAVTAAAMLVRTAVFDGVGGFDTAFARDFNDVDFCLRVRDGGYRVAWTPYAHFTHFEGASIARRKADPHESASFRERWAHRYPVDPYYSTALNSRLERIYEAL